jgi:hypothetical protein
VALIAVAAAGVTWSDILASKTLVKVSTVAAAPADDATELALWNAVAGGKDAAQFNAYL